MQKPIVDRLEVGKCYFLLGYHDRNLIIPFVEPYFFLGRDIYQEGNGSWFFQKAKAHLSGLPASSAAKREQSGVVEFIDDELESIVDWVGLVDELTENKKMQDQGRFLSQGRS